MYRIQPEALKVYHCVRLVVIHFGNLSFKRYMVSMLVTFYLQSCDLMPSIKDVQSSMDEKLIGGRGLILFDFLGLLNLFEKYFSTGWNVQFNETVPLSAYGIEKIDDYMVHVRGFFEFYKNFDFKNNVVIPYLGHSITKLNYLKHPELSE